MRDRGRQIPPPPMLVVVDIEHAVRGGGWGGFRRDAVDHKVLPGYSYRRGQLASAESRPASGGRGLAVAACRSNVATATCGLGGGGKRRCRSGRALGRVEVSTAGIRKKAAPQTRLCGGDKRLNNRAVPAPRTAPGAGLRRYPGTLTLSCGCRGHCFLLPPPSRRTGATSDAGDESGAARGRSFHRRGSSRQTMEGRG